MPVYHARGTSITIYCGDLFVFQNENLGGFDCIFDHGSIGSFNSEKVKRSTYADLMSSFTKPGGRVLLSIFDYLHSEHPSIPFAVTEEEVVNLYQESENYKHLKLLKKYDAEQTANLFNLHPGTMFPVWNFSHFSWKILLLY